MQPTAVFLPGESHKQRKLAGYSPWGHKCQIDLATKPPYSIDREWAISEGKSGLTVWGQQFLIGLGNFIGLMSRRAILGEGDIPHLLELGHYPPFDLYGWPWSYHGTSGCVI